MPRSRFLGVLVGVHAMAFAATIVAAQSAVSRTEMARATIDRQHAAHPAQIDIEIAFDFCVVTLAAQGEAFDSEVGIGIEFNCLGSSNFNSVWRQHMFAVLADRGIARAFGTFSRGAWDACIASMVAAPPERVRRGEAFEQFCLPAAERFAADEARRANGPSSETPDAGLRSRRPRSR